jgi:hypothetical protein
VVVKKTVKKKAAKAKAARERTHETARARREIIQNMQLELMQRTTQAFNNSLLQRRDLVNKLLDGRRDINFECNYPDGISPAEYRAMYDREGIAKVVVDIWPEECWAMDPVVQENDDAETPFEAAWDELRTQHNLYHFLEKVDKLSGIGRFGVILLGLSDGKDLKEPVEGINEQGEKVGTSTEEGTTDLLYVRVFDESVVTVDSRENDPANPRYGQPTMYTIKFTEVGEIAGTQDSRSVHWTRVIHIADNTDTSLIYGNPRMKPVYNPLLDIRKIRGGSGEMFWKGAFPGLALEQNPNISDAELDTDTVKTQMGLYQDSLQRFIALTGMSIKSLAPQVSDPNPHIDMNITIIAITIRVPKRKFIGSEQAQLASSQDERAWNKRLSRRRELYITPMLLRKFIDRMIVIGVLPEPVEYVVIWPDLNTVTDQEKGEVARVFTEAVAKYIQGGVDELIPPREFFHFILDMDPDEIEQIMKAAEEFQEIIDERKVEQEMEAQKRLQQEEEERRLREATLPTGEEEEEEDDQEE